MEETFRVSQEFRFSNANIVSGAAIDNAKIANLAKRWVQPFGLAIAGTSSTGTIGRVYMVEFEIETPQTVDAVSYTVGALSNGEVTTGIVGPLTVEETAAGLAVVVQSASTAQATANTGHVVTFTPTLLAKGRYFACLELSSGTGTFLRQSNIVTIPGIWKYYDRGGGYGALTSPTPATTDLSTGMPAMFIRFTGI